LLWLARCADAVGEQETALGLHARLTQSAADAMQWSCPVLLAADLDQAARLLDARQLQQADVLIRRLIDRQPLAHARPPVEYGHPLLARALALAERIGLSPREQQTDPWEDDY
jgi:hypothetical protein